MAIKRPKPEEIVMKLRQVDVTHSLLDNWTPP